MSNIFKHSSSHWVRYDRYDLREASNGKRYVTPAADAKPTVYDPLEQADALVVDALNVGMLMMKRVEDAEVQQAVMAFVANYGLLGLMTALPTTPTFMTYEAVYLPKNNFIKEEALTTEAYIQYFFPFHNLNIKKCRTESIWHISDDRAMQALAMTFEDKPTAVSMCMQREYAEQYDWLLAQFKDWAFTFCTSIFYYQDNATIDEDTKSVYHQAMAAFDGIAPSYHIELREKPTIVWDFHSLLLGIQMMFSFAIADEKKPLRVCKQCQKVFVANKAGSEFCCTQCRKRYTNSVKTSED